MLLNTFLQWNLQAHKTKFTNLKYILNKYQPVCVTLQETRIRNRNVKPPSQYNIVTSAVTIEDDYERGAAILVHRSYNYEPLNINSNLQVCALEIYLDRTYAVFSLYLPHIDITEGNSTVN